MNDRDAPIAETGLLLLVDHQRGIAENAQTSDHKTVDKNAARLAKAAQLFNLPIVVSVVGLRGTPELTRELHDALGDHVRLYGRAGTDSLDDPEISAEIARSGRSTLLIAGIVTEIAVQRPALSALRRGYRSQVVLDACNGRSERSERAALLRMTAAGVEFSSLPAIVGELAGDFADPRVKELLALMS